MDRNETKRVAEAHGLAALNEKHTRQLAESIAANRELVAHLPKDLHWSEEMAVVFRLPEPAAPVKGPRK